MKSSLILTFILLSQIGRTQNRSINNNYFETADLAIVAKIIDVKPDIMQDDVGTSYGSVSLKCNIAFDLHSKSITKCPTDTIYSLTYLSTNGNKPFIQLKNNMTVIAFLKSNKIYETQIIENFNIVDENAIFELTTELIYQLGLNYSVLNQMNLYEFIR